jgi:hypothetical protein
MTGRFWYVAIDGKPAGPYAEDQFRAFIAQGSVDQNALVWSEGMSAWERAGLVPGLIPPAVQRTAAPIGPPTLLDADAGNRVVADFPVWALFGRCLLYGLGMLLIIPAPWVTTGFCRWLIGHLRVPGRADLAFEGKPGDIWYVFILIALSPYLNVVPLLGFLAGILLSLVALRWFVNNISSQGRRLSLSFVGGFWGLLGWNVFFILSIITIIGWAWVLAAWMRWTCRNIAGSTRGVSFCGSGWQILWRSWVFSLLAALIIPIPWMLRWYARWWASQIGVGQPAG